jgi:nitroimidazol reductase NimA-like FMN-containing flavoprotein (pyridoxamine 5'-phosphate oxidase superfamily)
MNVQVLSREECLAHLRHAGVGRVATTYRALPAIIPVRYTMADGEVLFRAAGDPMLTQGCDGNVIAFEIDDTASDGRTGWSVMVVGTAHLLDEWVALEIGTISGRAVDGPVRVPA